MNLTNVVIVPSKSRYELELEKDPNQKEYLQQNLPGLFQSHQVQKQNLKKLQGLAPMIDRSALDDKVMAAHDSFVFLGGDDHFKYCAQNVLRFLKENPDEEKQVVGVVLDSQKSYGGLLSFDVDSFLDFVPSWAHGNYLQDQWTTLETDICPYPSVGDFFIGEFSRLYMSRNRLYCQEEQIGPEKTSGLLVATGAGSGVGSWFDNVRYGMFGYSHPTRFDSETAFVVFTENRERKMVPFREPLTIVSYNDDRGIIAPDSILEHAVEFPMGMKAESRISPVKLPVVKP